jgi:hypothetical protein
MKTYNLYGEDGFAVYLSQWGDICPARRGVVKVIGYALYCCSSEEAGRKVRAAYLATADAKSALADAFAWLGADLV